MDTLTSFIKFETTLSAMSSSTQAITAMKQAREIIERKEEKKPDHSKKAPVGLLRILASTTIQGQLIIGSTAGVLSGILANAAGIGWAVAVGASLVVLRVVGQIEYGPGPCSICGITPANASIFENLLEESMIFIHRNMLVAVGYFTGFIVAYHVTKPSQD